MSDNYDRADLHADEIAELTAQRDALATALEKVNQIWCEEMAHWPTCPSGNDYSEAGWSRCNCHMAKLRAALALAKPNQQGGDDGQG